MCPDVPEKELSWMMTMVQSVMSVEARSTKGRGNQAHPMPRVGKQEVTLMGIFRLVKIKV